MILVREKFSRFPTTARRLRPEGYAACGNCGETTLRRKSGGCSVCGRVLCPVCDDVGGGRCETCRVVMKGPPWFNTR